MKSRDHFAKRLKSEWLPAFCEARPDDIISQGFDVETIDSLSEKDAFWFLRAFDLGLIEESKGTFLLPQSKVKEQIFWEGPRGASPRKITLWLEPVITIGASARLVDEFGWPQGQIGAQSEYPWPFDLVAYSSDQSQEIIACEVKKSEREVDKLVQNLKKFGEIPPLFEEPVSQVERNSYRKVVGIRKSWPKFFWALGPCGYGGVFAIERTKTGTFNMKQESERSMEMPVNSQT